MRRREFIKVIAGSAAAWPLAARTQQPAMPVIGFLHSAAPAERAHLIAAFRQGLGTAGYRHVGTYNGRVLNGTKPADLPFVQSLVINNQTARMLGITVPPGLLTKLMR